MDKNKKYIKLLAFGIILLVGIYILLDLLPDKNGLSDGDHNHVRLTEFNAADMRSVEIKNKNGEFKILIEPKIDDSGEEYAECTLEGYDDAPVMSTLPETIAEDCTLLTAEREINKLGVADESYGLSNPEAQVKITMHDGKEVNFSLGTKISNGSYRYLGFQNDGAVYIIESEAVNSFFYGVYDLLSPDVIDDDEDFNTITLENAFLQVPVTIEISSDQRHVSVYGIVSPVKRTANNTTVRTMANNVRSLTADRVIEYNVNDEDIKKYGLSQPYARLTADYGNRQTSIITSKPDDDGNVYLMVQGGTIIYQAAKNVVPWSEADINSLKGQYILAPSFSALKRMSIKTADKTYVFDIMHEKYTDENGEEKMHAIVTLDGTNIDTDSFEDFLDYVSSAETTYQLPDITAEELPDVPDISIAYSYLVGGGDETVDYYASNDGKAVAVLNGIVDSYAYETYISKVQSELSDLIASASAD